MKLLLSIVLAVSLCAACGRRYNESDNVNKEAAIREHMMKANQYIVRNEAGYIAEFISRHQWDMKTTGTGLRYEIDSSETAGSAVRPSPNSVVVAAYKLYLLDSTLVDSTDRYGRQINLAGGDHPRGLQEGLQLMKEGSRARFVIPNHLGYGLSGDDDRIPPASPLFYEVRLVKVVRR
jgi:FKBP-type peptidyl-prolyl cis-trans isomerase